MADKTSFTKDEWTLLLESPMIAGMAITAAEPSGLWGLLKASLPEVAHSPRRRPVPTPMRWSNRSSRTFPAAKGEARREMA